MTFLQAAERVLERAIHPLTYKEMWESVLAMGLDKQIGAKNKGTRGKAPQIILVSQLYLNMQNEKSKSRFFISSRQPVTFWLKSRKDELKRFKNKEK